METSAAPSGTASDEAIVERVLAGDQGLLEILMRRHNRRLYRVARAVLGDDAEAEDVTQEAWVRAFEHLDQFARRASFATWVTKIALYEAYARARRRGRVVEMDAMDEPEREAIVREEPEETVQEQRVLAGEARQVLEAEISALAPDYRTVVMLRDVQGLDTAETADVLGISAAAVKVRLHRARAMLRKGLTHRFGAAARSAFAFDGGRCDRVVAAVLARLA